MPNIQASNPRDSAEHQALGARRSDWQHCTLPADRHYFLTPSPALTPARSLLLRAHAKSQLVTESSPTPAAFNKISQTPTGLERVGKHCEAQPPPPLWVWQLPAQSLLCRAGWSRRSAGRGSGLKPALVAITPGDRSLSRFGACRRGNKHKLTGKTEGSKGNSDLLEEEELARNNFSAIFKPVLPNAMAVAGCFRTRVPTSCGGARPLWDTGWADRQGSQPSSAHPTSCPRSRSQTPVRAKVRATEDARVF